MVSRIIIVSFVVAFLGAGLVILAGVLGFEVFPNYIDKKIEEQVRLIPGTDTWEKWANITRPIYFKAYIYNVVNPNAYLENGATPVFQEVGPYVYRQQRRKVNVKQPDGPHSVWYEQETVYIFDQEMSGNLRETDQANIFNLPLYLVIKLLQSLDSSLLPIPVSDLVNLVFATEKLVRTNVPIGDFLFNGMDVSIFTRLAAAFNISVPAEFEGGLFGLYRLSNGSTDGMYKIHTGVGASNHFGDTLLWNGRPELGFWESNSHCDKINGSDGSIFPPFIKKESSVSLFSSDLCRSVKLNYHSEVELHGIKSYRFKLPKTELDDPRTNSNNRCFCRAVDLNDCLLGGVIDISACRNGAPFVLSTPHFLNGNEKYSNDTGLRPIESKHETLIDIEPNSGVVMRAHKRIQVNINYQKIEGIITMANTTNLLFPIMWIDETAVLPEDSAKDLKDKLLSPKKAVETWRWIVLGVGVVLLLGGLALYAWKRKKSTYTV